MSWVKFFKREKWDEEIAAEMEAHLAHEIDLNVARGMSREEARFAAKRRLGNETKLREELYEMNTVGWLDTLWQDLRFGARMLRKSPGYTAIAVLTLALGIGANTAIFTLIDAVMLRSIPVRAATNLYVFEWHANKAPNPEWESEFGDCADGNSPANPEGCTFPKPTYEGMRDEAKVFSSVAAFAGPAELTISGTGEARAVSGVIVTGDFFSTLGVKPALGRLLSREDDTPAVSPVVLSYAFWKSDFGGDPAVLGRTISLNGAPFTVVGVSEQKFTNLSPGKTQELWMTISAAKAMGVRWAQRSDGISNWWLVLIGRIAPGVTRAQAEAEATILFRNQVVHGGQPISKEEDNLRITLIAAQAGLSGRRGAYATRLYVLSCAVGLILLIACANVAGLLLARSAVRQKEMALRLALGARRSRIVRQLLTESVLLSAIGGAVGIAFAFWGVRAITSLWAGVSGNRFAFVVAPDWRVLAFTLGASMFTGILFGLAPAMRNTRLDLTSALKENAPTAWAALNAGPWWRRIPMGSALVVAQVALSVVVMIGAGLLVRTIDRLRNVDLGFDAHNVLQFEIDPTRLGMKDEQAQNLYRQLRDEFAALAGVSSATYSSGALLSGGQWQSSFHLDGGGTNQDHGVDELAIGPEFLRSSRIKLLAGRDFTPEDFERAARKYDEDTKTNGTTAPTVKQQSPGAMSPPARVPAVVPVLVNRAFVENYLPNENPLGRTLARGGFGGATNARSADPPSREYEIVGIVANTKYGTLRDGVAPLLIVPDVTGGVEFEIRTVGDPNALVPAIRKIVGKQNSALPVSYVRTETEQIGRLMEQERFLARFVGFAGALAMLLACIGLYGLLSYEVARRTREIGVRMALGARRGDVLRMVLGHGVRLAAIGVVLGAVAAVSVTRYLESLLYEVRANDPATFAGIGVLILCVSVAASYVPTRRATRVDPMVALRYE
jgi:predicted permease